MEGKIVQVMGPVVDIEFDGYLSAINDAIDQKFSLISMKFPQKYTFNQIAYELRSIYKESIC